MKRILLIAALLFSFVIADAQTKHRIVRFYFDNQNSVNRQFPTLVHFPAAYTRDSTTQKYPLIVFLHGAGEGYNAQNGTDNARIDGRRLNNIFNSDQAGGPAYFIENGGWIDSFRVGGTGAWQHPIVASPQAPAWSANSDQANYIIKGLVEKYPAIDVNRIYVTGLSAGGEGVVNLGARTLDNGTGSNLTQFNVFYKMAAMVPMSQANAASSWKAGVAVADSIRAWGFGQPPEDVKGDLTKLQMQYMSTAKAGFGRFTDYVGSGAHCCWNLMYTPSYKETINGQSMNMYEWMLQFSRAVVTNPTVAFNPVFVNTTLPADSITLTTSTLTPGTGATFTGYAWTKISGPGTPTIVTPTASSTKLRGLLVGEYKYRLTATNSAAQTGFGEITITVNDVSPTVTVSSTSLNLPTSTTALTSTPVTNYTITSRQWYPLKKPGQAAYRLVVAGSSTVLGSGLSNSSNSFVNKFAAWMTANGLGNVTNNGVAGTNIDQINIPGLFTTGPQAVLLGFVSNGYTAGEGRTITQIAQKFQQVADSCAARGVLFFTFGTMPRDEYSLSDRARLKTINDTLAARFGNRFIDVYTPLVNTTDNSIKPQFTIAGDQIHVNDAGHEQLYQLLRAKGIFSSLVTGVTIASPTAQNTNVSGLTTAGTYLIQHSFIDSRGYAATGVSTVQVNPAGNVAPVANAGADVTITLPTASVSLSGTASTDADGTIATYRWSRVTGSSFYNFGDSTLATTTVSGLQAGVYIFRLTVTDNGGLSHTDDKQVTVLPAAGPTTRHIIKAVPSEYVSFALMEDSLVYRYFFWTPTNKVEWKPFDLGGKKAKDVAVGFNRGLILDTDGYAYISASGQNVPFKVTTDTLGNPFNYNKKIYGYFYAYSTLTEDGRIMYFGQDDYKLYSTGNINITRPIQLSPAGVQYKEVIMSKYIYGITVGGVIHRWNRLGSRTPTVLALPGGVACATLASSHNDFTIAIGVDGHPYALGNDYQYWGGSSVYTSFTSIKNLWSSKVSTGIKMISANHNIIAFTDSLNQLYTLGDNAQGEVGNGQEWVNKKELNTFGWYNWSWGKGVFGWSGLPYKVEFPGGAPVQIVSIGQSNVFAFLSYFIDSDGNTWFWGRRKSFVGWDGVQINPENTYPNAGDILRPKIVQPWLSTPATSYTFTPGTLDAGPTVFTTDSVVTLNATGNPSTGYSWVSRSWTIVAVSGDSLTNAVIESPSAQTTRITNINPGTYRLNIQFVDNNGATISDTVSIIKTGSTSNLAPVVNAGTDISVTLPTNSINLNGSANDLDGEILSYQWTKVAGPNAGIIVSDGNPSTPVTGLIAGTYRYRLTAKDTAGLEGFDEVTVTVSNGANVLPLVNAGVDRTINTTQVTLVGTATDADGTIASVAWQAVSRPIGSPAPVITVQALTTIITGFSTTGDYLFRLQATDNSGGVAYDTIKVTYVPPNVAPTANAGANVQLTLPANSTTLSGSGSDQDGSIIQYSWVRLSGPATYTLGSPNAASTTLTNLVAGTYIFRLTVTDNNNATGSDDVQVQILSPTNIPPTANAGADRTVTTSSTTLSGIGSDVDGSVTAVLWSLIDQPIGSVTPNILTPSLNNTTVTSLTTLGDYRFRFRVTDNSGAIAYDTVKITVGQAANIPPTAFAGDDRNINASDGQFTLAGSGTDIDGTIVSYLWTKVSGSPQTIISNANTATPTISNLVAGVYVFRLTVTDNRGASASDDILVSVNIIIPDPTGVKTVNVSMYSTSMQGMINLSGWNNWALLPNVTNTMSLQDSLGRPTGFSATLSLNKGGFDNGSAYGGKMISPLVLRYGVHADGPTTFTLTGLNPGNTYDITFYSSRDVNDKDGDVFTYGILSQTIMTWRNKTVPVTFVNVVPAANGTISLGVAPKRTYIYVNGFTVKQK